MVKQLFNDLVLVSVCVSTCVFAKSQSTEIVELRGQQMQLYVREQTKQMFSPATAQKALKQRLFSLPKGWSQTRETINGIPVERLAPEKARTSKVIFQLHGGGYILPLGNSHRNLAAALINKLGVKEVVAVDYRIAPQHTYPGALEDSFKVYQELIKKVNPADIIITGDSAGGNLAVELALKIKEKNLPQPSMLILMSPWATLGTTPKSREENFEKDLILGENNPMMYQEVQNPSYLGKYSPQDPRLSPIYADLKGLPPMLIQVGSYELFRDEGFQLAFKAASDNVKVTITSYPEMSHDFSLVLPELDDSRSALDEVASFVKNNE